MRENLELHIEVDRVKRWKTGTNGNDHRISINFERFAEPLVSIRGSPDMYVKHGSPVTLHCHIDSFLKIPSRVDWYLNRTLLSQLKITPKHGITFLLMTVYFYVSPILIVVIRLIINTGFMFCITSIIFITMVASSIDLCSLYP